MTNTIYFSPPHRPGSCQGSTDDDENNGVERSGGAVAADETTRGGGLEAKLALLSFIGKNCFTRPETLSISSISSFSSPSSPSASESASESAWAVAAAQQERSILVSTLLPILEDYSLQPPVLDAQSIASSLKVLFEQMQEKLILTEAKLKESQYQLPQWRSDLQNPPSSSQQSLAQSIGAKLITSNKNRIELAPQPPYSHGQMPISSEALPAIEGFQISGDAIPGRELQACGYSINGTTSCNFEWVRYLEDGSVNYIEGAKQPNYLVTADDVGTYLAIEVQPLDNKKRKGELVKVFANEQNKITCDPEMQEYIDKTLYSGNASYVVSFAVGYLDIWEPATLTIKREGYSIKCSGPLGLVVTEKFLPITAVTIPSGHPTAFSILGAGGVEHPLKTNDSSGRRRDAIVLTLRLFIVKAVEGKGKKKALFFHK